MCTSAEFIARSRSRQSFTRWSALWDDIQVGTYTRGIIVRCKNVWRKSAKARRTFGRESRWSIARRKYHAALGHLRYVVVNCTIYYTQQLPISAVLNAVHVMHDFYSIC